MTANEEELELKDRLNLIETMIAEGRRTTESWGWVFVLWGVAYYVAIAWSAWGNHASLAWNITMAAAMIVTFGVVVWRKFGGKEKSQPATKLGRAVTSVWMAVGISFMVLIPSLGIGGRSNSNLVVAVIGTLLGTANAASSMILRWKMQFACAVVWWALAIISCIGTHVQSFYGLLVANFFCQIVFGLYGMIAESRKQKAARAGQGVSHA
jgi:hypothetical protein